MDDSLTYRMEVRPQQYSNWLLNLTLSCLGILAFWHQPYIQHIMLKAYISSFVLLWLYLQLIQCSRQMLTSNWVFHLSEQGKIKCKKDNIDGKISRFSYSLPFMHILTIIPSTSKQTRTWRLFYHQLTDVDNRRLHRIIKGLKQ